MGALGTFKAGLVQMSSTNDRAENMASAETLIRAAAAQGAQIILTPEMTTLIELDRTALLDKIYSEAEDPSLPVFQALAAELNIWLVIGSMAVRVGDRIANRCYVLSPDGRIAAYYDKIHMFDVDLPGGEQYRESRSYAAGERAVLAATPFGKIGLSICYDLRFPHLYRMLAQGGADVLTVPAAFTQVTGKAHWHILLRARAIENGTFIFAPAQTGRHMSAAGETRETYGHSLFVDPWGNIIDDGGEDVGIIVAEIDPALCEKARSRIPSLKHDRVILSDNI
ncbi:MAG TPA: carbon-nitrogen hydrolase family protein [Sphingomonadales bacterium]|nr:carbon-nitrogen hydrolase family protein [Sphingomonadales bacterium]